MASILFSKMLETWISPKTISSEGVKLTDHLSLLNSYFSVPLWASA